MSLYVAILQAMRAHADAGGEPKTLDAWAEQFGCARTYISRVSVEHKIPTKPKRQETAKATVTPRRMMQTRPESKPCERIDVRIPTSLARAAGLLKGGNLLMTAEPGRVIVTLELEA